MRLFTAVYPSPAATAHLGLALGSVGGPARTEPGAGLRWVPAEQQHVTLLFHGEVPDGAVPEYADSLVAVLRGSREPELALAGSGSFGGRTLWVGLTGDLDGLRRLAAAAEGAAAEAGLPGADRVSGRPHLTVARASPHRIATRRRGAGRRAVDGARGGARRHGDASEEPMSPLLGWSRALAVYRGPSWRVSEVRVVSSRLGEGRSGGPAHEDVAVVALAS